jgi:hypothetical protein
MRVGVQLLARAIGAADNPKGSPRVAPGEIGGMTGLLCILKMFVLLFATPISAVFISIRLPILPIPEPARHGLPAGMR